MLKSCGARCAGVMDAFNADLHHGQAVARERLKTIPTDEDSAVLPRQAGSELRVAAARAPRTARPAGTSTGKRDVARRGAEAEPDTRPRPSRPRLDRLHRRHAHAVGHALGARRRQQETRSRAVREASTMKRGFSCRPKRNSRCGTCTSAKRISTPPRRSPRSSPTTFPTTTRSRGFFARDAAVRGRVPGVPGVPGVPRVQGVPRVPWVLRVLGVLRLRGCPCPPRHPIVAQQTS